MTEAVSRPRRLELSGAVEARRPVPIAVVVGLSAGAYAASLAGVTALQAASDRQLAEANAPAGEMISALTEQHDRLGDRLVAAGSAYGSAANAYADITAKMTQVEKRLAKLAGQVSKVQGAAAWTPTLPRTTMPSISKSAAPPPAKPASNGSSGASGH
jgi:hypothetical protein